MIRRMDKPKSPKALRREQHLGHDADVVVETLAPQARHVGLLEVRYAGVSLT